jgi:hypothetical protein
MALIVKEQEIRNTRCMMCLHRTTVPLSSYNAPSETSTLGEPLSKLWQSKHRLLRPTTKSNKEGEQY